MQKTLHVRTKVLPGGKVEVFDEDLTVGESVDVVISPTPAPTGRSAWQIISEGPRERVFKNAKEVDEYIAEERASWDR